MLQFPDVRRPLGPGANDATVALIARDAEALAAFYAEILGCVEERRVPEANGLIQLRAGASLIDIVDRSEGVPDGQNVDHFCLRIEPTDMSALAETLRGMAGMQ